MLENHVREFLKRTAGNWSCPTVATVWAGGHGKHHGGGDSPFGFGGGAGGGSGGGFPPFPPFGGFPWNFFRRARAKRGDVRAAILSLLAEKPLNGYQIMQELEQRSRGAWRPSPGAVYPALQQLEDEGLVRAETSSGGRTFSLTDEGRKYVQEHPDEFEAPWETAGPTDEGVLGLFAELKQIAAATIQVVHTGSSRQVLEAQKVLNQARRALYRLLSEAAPDASDKDED